MKRTSWGKMLRKYSGPVEKVLIFMIALGLGEFIRRVSLWFHTATFVDIIFVATKLGIILYILTIGLRYWVELAQIDAAAERAGGVPTGCSSYGMYPILYWVVAAIMAFVMF